MYTLHVQKYNMRHVMLWVISWNSDTPIIFRDQYFGYK